MNCFFGRNVTHSHKEWKILKGRMWWNVGWKMLVARAERDAPNGGLRGEKAKRGVLFTVNCTPLDRV